MRTSRVWIVTAACSLAATLVQGEPWRVVNGASSGTSSVVLIADGSPGSHEGLAACRQVLEVLDADGWKVEGVVVRIQANPFDATDTPADIHLPAGNSPGDNVFELSRAVIRRSLGDQVPPSVVELVAGTVASHLSPPESQRRMDWESAWMRRLAAGDVLSTVLPELVFRAGGDAALRECTAGEWPQSAIEVLRELGYEDPLRAASELTVAALLQPSLLGWSATPTRPVAHQGGDGVGVFLGVPGVRTIALPSATGAAAVQTLRVDGAAAWLAVSYSLTNSFDAFPLEEGSEHFVPLTGVRWAAVVLVSIEPGARASFAFRPLVDYPQRLRSWDFLAADGHVSIAWEVEQHESLAAYVVETLRTMPGGALSCEHRSLIPAAGGESDAHAYVFADEGSADTSAYRLLALTREGLLAEIATFPVGNEATP